MRQTLGFLVLFLLLFACGWTAPAADAWAAPDEYADIPEVRVVGPSWEGFTNRDGTGLYHEILNKLFALYGIRVHREYVPSERAYHLVRTGQADFMTCHDKPLHSLVLAKHPMYAGRYYAFFNRENIGEWNFPESMRGRTIAWRIGYYDESNIPVPMKVREVKSGISGLGMVILGRVDFYLDDLNFIQTSIKHNTLPMSMDDFRIETVGTRSYHPVFNTSERGSRIMELYDKGMERLYKSGELRKIFERWGFAMPDYDIP